MISVEQNADQFLATVTADQPSENSANQVASGLRSYLALALGWTDGDEKLFLSEMEATSKGKAFLLRFDMPKAQVQELIHAAAESKTKEQKPNGNAGFRPSEVTAAK